MPPPPIPPRPSPPHQPRVVLYHQTHHHNGQYVSLLPLLTETVKTASGLEILPVTHVIIAAFHLNEQPGDITLNNHPPENTQNESLWREVSLLQAAGVTVLGMLGGAAKGTYARLDSEHDEGGFDDMFEYYYRPLAEVVRRYGLQGLDLDIEEEMSLGGVVRLVDRLRVDFGPGFMLTMAPVATALQGRQHLSGFDYEALEVMRGKDISWYNTQFYNNWGRLDTFVDYDAILRQGWNPEKIVVGVLTNPGLGHGYIEFEHLQRTLAALSQFYPGFGGVMGWEYFNSRPGGEERPWEWTGHMTRCVRNT